MDGFVVESGIEVPPDKRGAGKYPFHEMNVGDSFFIACKTSDHVYHSASRCASGYGKRHKKKFVTRSVEGGIRIWRTA